MSAPAAAAARARGIDVSGPFFSNSALVLRKAALADMGIAVLPDYCVRDCLSEGSLVRVLPQFRLAPRPILVVRPRTKYMTEKDRLFVDFQLSSLFRWAWTFAEIQLEGPRLDVSLAPDGRLNLAELADSFPQSEPAERQEPAPPRRLLLQGVAQEQAARHLIVDDQNFDFFGDGHYSLPSLRSAAAFRTSSPMEPRGSWVSTAPNS